MRKLCAIQHLCDLDSGCRCDLRHENGDGGPVPGEWRGQSDSCGCRGQDRPRGPPGRGRGRVEVEEGTHCQVKRDGGDFLSIIFISSLHLPIKTIEQ